MENLSAPPAPAQYVEDLEKAFGKGKIRVEADGRVFLEIKKGKPFQEIAGVYTRR